MIRVYFHPQISVLEASDIARSIGCVLRWRGKGFVLVRRKSQ